jgi:hypothetical protein
MQKVRRFVVANDPPDGGAGDTQRGDASVTDEPHVSPSDPAVEQERTLKRSVDAQRTKYADVEA